MLKICDHPLITHRLDLIRNKEVSSAEFRRNLRDIAMFLTYEAIADLPMEEYDIETPMEKMKAKRLAASAPVLVSILRAGNGFLDGALEVLPEARIGFLGMYRDEETLRPVDYYSNLPSDLKEAPVILLDPMLATGHSAKSAIEFVKKAGGQDIRLVTLVSAPEGVKVIEDYDPNIKITTASLDRGLNEKGYIMPGLGDAGDRIFNSL